MEELSLPGWDDPELARLGAAFRAELRAEAEAYEALAAKDLLRRRNLTDVALELVHRGDRVAALVGGMTFTGVVGYASGDLACLRTTGGDVDLRLTGPIGLRVVEPVRSGGLPRGVGPASFTARLHEHEAAGVELELGCLHQPAALRGRLAAVGADHVVLLEPTGQRCYVALAAIVWARPV
jgi:hypothetical protein